MAEHLVVWHIDKGKIESGLQGDGAAIWSVESLSERVQRDLSYYRCSRIHAVNGYGCALLDGNLSSIMLDLAKYPPCLRFQVRPSTDLSQVGVMLEKMRQGAVQNTPDMEHVAQYSIDRLADSNTAATKPEKSTCPTAEVPCLLNPNPPPETIAPARVHVAERCLKSI